MQNTLLDHVMNYKGTRDLGSQSGHVVFVYKSVLSESHWGLGGGDYAFISTGKKLKRRMRWVM